jgi:hypothetical protein
MVNRQEKDASVDYVRLIPMNEPGVQILLNYYKYIEGL